MSSSTTNDTNANDDDPSPRGQRHAAKKGWGRAFLNLFHRKSDASLRKTIEEYIEEFNDENGNSSVEDPLDSHERFLFSNILSLRDLTADQIMIPRADIVAIEANQSEEEILKFFASVQVSRVPVYKETLDNVIGTVHIKDILVTIAEKKPVKLPELITEVPVISPSLPLLDLLHDMRQNRRHMAMVVDEFGGIDGLVTIGDIIEAIVGEIDDEHDLESAPQMVDTANGHVLADARASLEDFCEKYQVELEEEELEENDTLGGLAFSIAGKVPARGEILTHPGGMVMEILDANPRRINRIRIKNIRSKENIAI